MLRACALFCALVFSWNAALAADAPAQAGQNLGYSEEGLKKLFDQVVRTGVGVDAIPSLYRPKYVNVSDASLSLDDNDVVFIVTYPEGRTRIYPQRIMVWHEVVNDVLPDASGNLPPTGAAEAEANSYTISYSPLSGSVIAFRSIVGKFPTTFGNTGDLLNANAILYDRISVSHWSQLLGLCINGPFRGKRLDRIQVLWATWKGVKQRYNGKAEVLSRSTGVRRPYGKDPYGSYQTKGTYYDDVRLFYPLLHFDNRLPPKRRILGIEEQAVFGAVQVDEVKTSRYLNFSLGLRNMVALYDESIDTVRVFDRQLTPGQPPLTFMILEDAFVDDRTKSQWNPEGQCTYGRYRGQALTPVFTIDAMWFAWAAFHKTTQIFPYTAR